ncbi:MAG: hypothetical protein ACLGHN_05730 [Bacteriovoracia bacterium]
MKTAIALVIALNSLSALAGGFHTKFFTKSFKASTEAELVALVEAAIPSIKDGSDRSVRQDFSFEGCWPVTAKQIKVNSLSVAKYYKAEGETLVPYYSGTLSFLHKNCRYDR